jgi:tetratricopeptide (TPR) repeat protein
MPNGVYQDVARYYLSRGDAQTRKVDPMMQNLPENAKVSYEHSAEALERAREMDQAVNQASRESRLARGVPTTEILDVGNFRIYQNLGVAYLRLRRFDDALQAFNDMQRLEPTQGDVYYNKAIAWLSKGQLEPALHELLRALILKSDSNEYWEKLNLAFANALPGQQVVLKLPDGRWNLNAEHPLVRRLINESLLGLMQIMVDTKRWQQAMEVYQLAVDPKRYNCPPAMFESLLRQVKAVLDARAAENTDWGKVGMIAVILIGVGLIVLVSLLVIKIGASSDFET